MNITWLLEQGPCRDFAAGEEIPCSAGADNGNKAMYILLSGSVEAIDKNASGTAPGGAFVIAPGDVFGGREYFIGACDFTYIASGDVTVYLLTKESFDELSWSHPEVLFEILRSAYSMPVLSKTQAAAKSVPQTAVPKPAAVSKPAPAAVQKPTPQAAVPKPVPHAAAKPTPPAAAPKPAPPAAAVQKPMPQAGGEISGGIFPAGHMQYENTGLTFNDKLIFPKEYKCPYCSKPFQDYRVFRTKLFEAQPMRYDLRRIFRDFHVEWFDVLTCSNCLFSTFHNYFTEPKPLRKTEIEGGLNAARATVHMDTSSVRDINYVFTSHYLALLCAAAYPTMSRQISAKLWGNLSWLYEDVADNNMEKMAAQKAADAYERVYTESRLTPVQEQITCLSIAGMQHRAGIDKHLRKFLFTVKTQKMGDKLYAKLAEDFMYELKIAQEEE
ncbi:MAG: DUF2225 domain-containing protein [Oscillospiraceae bacterium]|nr:DUF2225 domain-containing protein [Oscillospiraceae bacterium]